MQPTNLPIHPPDRAAIREQLRAETADRLARIDREFAEGFNLINKYNDTVTFFGSARFPDDHPYYQKARDIAGALAAEGYTIVTGGGGGIMEAGDRGAKEEGGTSLGLNITLPHEQSINPYATDTMAFRYFFTRKVILSFGATAYLFFPGGYGTLDEFFEVITLIQTKKMPAAPIILVGSEYWTALDIFIKTYLLDHAHTISPGDEKLYEITEDPAVIVAAVNHYRDTSSAFTEEMEGA